MENKDQNTENTEKELDNGEEKALTPEEKKAALIKDVIDIAESTIITVFFIVLLFTYVLHPVNIVGQSMVPTLNKNYNAVDGESTSDKIFMNTIFFKLNYGDIVIIDNDEPHLLDESGNAYVPQGISALKECIIKRVIATEGQSVKLDYANNKIYVDGKELDEPYVKDGATFGGNFGNYAIPEVVPEGKIFVMGDNRSVSLDSRSTQIGLVNTSDVMGKAQFAIFPFDRFGAIG